MKKNEVSWFWEKENSENLKTIDVECFETNEIIKGYEYNLELAFDFYSGEYMLFKMIDKTTEEVFFVVGNLFCNLQVKAPFKDRSKDSNGSIKIIESNEIEFLKSDFNYKELSGYIDHHYYFQEYRCIPFSRPNSDVFDGNGYIDTDNYGFLEISKIDEINKLIESKLNFN